MDSEASLKRFDEDLIGKRAKVQPMQTEFLDKFNKDKIARETQQKNSNDQLFDLIDRKGYGNDEFDIENVLKNMRHETNARTEAAQKIKDMIKLKQTEKSRHTLQKVVKERIARDKQINRMQNEIMAQGTVNDMVDNAVEHSAARTIQSATRNNKAIKEVAKRYTDKQVQKLQSAVRNHNARKEVKQQKVANNLGKLSEGATNNLKEGWKGAIKQHQSSVSNFGKLTHGLQQQQHQQRLDAAAIRPADILGVSGSTRGGAKFGATEAQLNAPSRMQLHRERNPELTQLRQQISDNTRGKLQLTDVQKAGIKTRIEQLVEINKALKAKGAGPKLGRPKK